MLSSLLPYDRLTMVKRWQTFTMGTVSILNCFLHTCKYSVGCVTWLQTITTTALRYYAIVHVGDLRTVLEHLRAVAIISPVPAIM